MLWGRPGARGDGPDRPPRAPVQPDLVVVHLPVGTIGTVVTGTCGLADATGLPLFGGAAVLFYVVLVVAWVVVAVRTTRGVWSGRLLVA